MSQYRDPITGRWVYQNNANAYLRAALAAKGRQPILSEVVEAPTSNADANELLRQIIAGTSVNTRRDALRAVVDAKAAPAAPDAAASPASLDDLLRQIVAGNYAEEATE